MSHKPMSASSPMCDLLVMRCSNIFCAIHGERVAEISSLRVFALHPQRSIFLAGGSEQPRPPTRPTRVHGSARSIFRDHPPHYRPKLNCPLQATLAMQCGRAVAGPHALPGLRSPRPTWELRLWSSRSTRPSFTEAYLGATGGRGGSGCLVARNAEIWGPTHPGGGGGDFAH